MQAADVKKKLGLEAALLVKEGQTLALGSGTTANAFIEALGERVKLGLKVLAVASSPASAALATKVGIKVVDPNDVPVIDLCIDGADEIDTKGNLIKGGGGALLREKILARQAKRFVVIAAKAKQVRQLGAFALPVEIIPFAASYTEMLIKKTLGTSLVDLKPRSGFVSADGNWIVDLKLKSIPDPASLHAQLKSLCGVVETGLFCGFHPELLLA